MQEQPVRWKPLTEEQMDDMLEAFNELQATNHFTALIGQSGNVAVEIREQVVDPETLAFILDVADRHQLRPYIFRTEHSAPIVLQPMREAAETTQEPEADPAEVVQLPVAQEAPSEPQEAEDGKFQVTALPNTFLVTLPVEGLEEDDWPMAQFNFETADERRLAGEVAEQAGSLAAARVAEGTAPAHALAEAHEVGTRAFEKAKVAAGLAAGAPDA